MVFHQVNIWPLAEFSVFFFFFFLFFSPPVILAIARLNDLIVSAVSAAPRANAYSAEMFGYYPAATHSSAGGMVMVEKRRKTIHFPSIRPPVNFFFFFFFLVSTFSIRVIHVLLVIDITGAKRRKTKFLLVFPSYGLVFFFFLYWKRDNCEPPPLFFFTLVDRF